MNKASLLRTRTNYQFNIDITSIPQVAGFIVNPPCPRVNAWAAGSTSFTYITAVTGYDKKYDVTLQGNAGADIFYWPAYQTATVKYDGRPVIITETAGAGNDQTKLQIRYEVPDTYNIVVTVSNKAPAAARPDPFTVDTTDVCVSGAGTNNVNGTYVYSHTQGTKGVWMLSTVSEILSTYWDNTLRVWKIDSDINYYYYSTQNVNHPWNVSQWIVLNGDLPTPIVLSGACV